MSGLEIVGLISAVISIVEAVEIVYNGIRDTRNLPRAFREVAKKLPLVRDTLRIAERQIGASTDDEACQAVKTVVESCKVKAEELKDIFDAVSASDNASRFERYRVAVRRFGKGSLVETLAQELMEEVRLLGTNRAVQAATEAQAAELLKAIEELSSMEPSLPDEKSVSQHHSGSGDNVAGNKYQGNHNVYSGSGTAYFGGVTQ
ncbi:Pfs, NACHT, and ankyrin domain-containingprotein [Fusarium falciforme]|uniref:Pfs, NACHT, and ankyrin domain-containingprotein n=1 Tax=Fusarium falciforme TaxID=195108 RepID=UPI0023006A30|nr:Pfs, NACHT, and ankyrin domain-containingprotein [Fusarium falciforme]WAO94398.1 Pfs, NACHT, and ankyrin domain-containingprotein [Fusarium falciforme]